MKFTPFSAFLPDPRVLSMQAERFLNARSLFADLLAEGGYEQSRQPAYYVLEYRSGDRNRRFGLGGLIDTLEYGGETGKIRPHEATLKPRIARQRESYLKINHLLKPVLLTCPAFDALQSALREISSCREPAVCFPDEAGGDVGVYPVSEGKEMDRLNTLLEQLPSTIAVADGHHRITTAHMLALEPGTEARFARIPAVLIPANSLSIDSYLRSVAGGEGNEEAILEKLATFFRIEAVAEAETPLKKGNWLLIHKAQLYRLTVIEPTGMPDASWFDRSVLPEVFLIRDSTNDERLTATPAERGQEVLRQLAAAAPGDWHFQPPPVSMEVFFDYVASRKLFPPKSTRFLPRVPSGLIVKALPVDR